MPWLSVGESLPPRGTDISLLLFVCFALKKRFVLGSQFKGTAYNSGEVMAELETAGHITATVRKLEMNIIQAISL